jgi:UV DNA damage endonuclease
MTSLALSKSLFRRSIHSSYLYNLWSLRSSSIFARTSEFSCNWVSKTHMAPKRKRSSVAASATQGHQETTIPPPRTPGRRTSKRALSNTNPNYNDDVLDGVEALRASPDSGDELGVLSTIVPKRAKKAILNGSSSRKTSENVKSVNGELEIKLELNGGGKPKKMPTKSSISAKKGSDEIKAYKAEREAAKQQERLKDGIKNEPLDPEDEGDVLQDLDLVKQEAIRSPPVNSNYLPLPWVGRLGYVSNSKLYII